MFVVFWLLGSVQTRTVEVNIRIRVPYKQPSWVGGKKMEFEKMERISFSYCNKNKRDLFLSLVFILLSIYSSNILAASVFLDQTTIQFNFASGDQTTASKVLHPDRNILLPTGSTVDYFLIQITELESLEFGTMNREVDPGFETVA